MADEQEQTTETPVDQVGALIEGGVGDASAPDVERAKEIVRKALTYYRHSGHCAADDVAEIDELLARMDG